MAKKPPSKGKKIQSAKGGKNEKSRKSKKPSKRGSRAKVFRGSSEITSGGLHKNQLLKNEYGRIVSAKKSRLGKARYATNEKLRASSQALSQLAKESRAKGEMFHPKYIKKNSGKLYPRYRQIVDSYLESPSESP